MERENPEKLRNGAQEGAAEEDHVFEKRTCESETKDVEKPEQIAVDEGDWILGEHPQTLSRIADSHEVQGSLETLHLQIRHFFSGVSPGKTGQFHICFKTTTRNQLEIAAVEFFPLAQQLLALRFCQWRKTPP